MNNNIELLLSEILDCGIGDLCILEGCNYNWSDIVNHCKENYGESSVTLENLFYSIIDFGMMDLVSEIEEKIDEIKKKIYETNDEDEIDKLESVLEELRIISPQDDIGFYFNYLDNNVYFNNNEEIYTRYLKDEIDNFENNTGFSLY